MILVPLFARSTVYGSIKNLLSLPFQASVFFAQGYIRTTHPAPPPPASPPNPSLVPPHLFQMELRWQLSKIWKVMKFGKIGLRLLLNTGLDI